MLDCAAERVEKRWLVEENDKSMEPLNRVSRHINHEWDYFGDSRNAAG
jgi:hypothetical protein